MNCSEFDCELEQLVETRHGTLTESAADHAKTCAGCHQRWQEHRLLEVALRGWSAVATPTSLVDGVLGQLLNDRRPCSVVAGASAESRSRWMVLAVVALCLILTWGLGIVGRPAAIDRAVAVRETRKSGTGPVRDSASRAQSSAEVASSVAAVFDDLRSEYRELAAETRATARELAVVLPTSAVSPWSDLGASEASKHVATESGNEIDAGAASSGAVSVIGRSIGSQISEAMDFLWVAVPDGVPRG